MSRWSTCSSSSHRHARYYSGISARVAAAVRTASFRGLQGLTAYDGAAASCRTSAAAAQAVRAWLALVCLFVYLRANPRTVLPALVIVDGLCCLRRMRCFAATSMCTSRRLRT